MPSRRRQLVTMAAHSGSVRTKRGWTERHAGHKQFNCLTTSPRAGLPGCAPAAWAARACPWLSVRPRCPALAAARRNSRPRHVQSCSGQLGTLGHQVLAYSHTCLHADESAASPQHHAWRGPHHRHRVTHTGRPHEPLANQNPIRESVEQFRRGARAPGEFSPTPPGSSVTVGVDCSTSASSRLRPIKEVRARGRLWRAADWVDRGGKSCGSSGAMT